MITKGYELNKKQKPSHLNFEFWTLDFEFYLCHHTDLFYTDAMNRVPTVS
jgi:hypothetical protein